MALRAEVVDLVRLHFLHDVDQAAGVCEVAVVEDEVGVVDVGIFIQMVDAVGIEERGAALDAVDRVALLQQELREIGAVLPGDPGDESCLWQSLSFSCGLSASHCAGLPATPIRILP